MCKIVLDPKSQKSLWEHLYKKCVIRLVSKEEYKERKKILAKIEEEVLNGTYSPKPIHGFLSAPKANYVARFIPVFNFQDIAVFFGCIKKFDEDLAKLAIEDTFGLWTLGGKRREFEEEQAKEIVESSIDEYVPVATYNRMAWISNWSEYWKLVESKYKNSPDDASFAMLDIANFYDSIDLPKLERELRKYTSKNDFAIDVCIFLLSTWNKKLSQYSRSTKGIPMDIIGDCSRILANFYLVPSDIEMRRKSEEFDSNYMRYADDMVLICPDKETSQNFVYFASNELHKIGLNINVDKVKYFNKEEFEIWWGFDILKKINFDILDFTNENIKEFIEGLNLLDERWDYEGFGRKKTIFMNAINKLAHIKKLKQWNKWAFKKACEDEDFFLNFNDRQMKNLIGISESKIDAITSLSDIVLKNPFTQPKACLLRCVENYQKNVDLRVRDLSNQIISDIKKLNDSVINLTFKNMPKA